MSGKMPNKRIGKRIPRDSCLKIVSRKALYRSPLVTESWIQRHLRSSLPSKFIESLSECGIPLFPDKALRAVCAEKKRSRRKILANVREEVQRRIISPMQVVYTNDEWTVST